MKKLGLGLGIFLGLAIVIWLVKREVVTSSMPTGSVSEQTEDIQETALSAILTISGKKWSPFFLKVDQKDPAPHFIQRLTAQGLIVKPASQSLLKKGLRVDAKADKTVILFTIDKVIWSDSKSAYVGCNYYSSNLLMTACGYSVKWEGRKWRVQNFVNCISR